MAPHKVSPRPEQTEPQTSLLDLPPEIWSKIGKMAIDDCPYLTVGGITGQYWPLRNKRFHEAWQPPITKTCRSVREELLPYYYRTKIQVQAPVYGGDQLLHCVGAWLRGIGQRNRASVAGLTYVSLHTPAEASSELLGVQAALCEMWLVPMRLEMVGKVCEKRIWGGMTSKMLWTVVLLG